MPVTPTVSRCALSISERPPPPPRSVATTLGRPGSGSTSSTSRPASINQPATKEASAASPAAPATSSGLIESMATSRPVRSATWSSPSSAMVFRSLAGLLGHAAQPLLAPGEAAGAQVVDDGAHPVQLRPCDRPPILVLDQE